MAVRILVALIAIVFFAVPAMAGISRDDGGHYYQCTKPGSGSMLTNISGTRRKLKKQGYKCRLFMKKPLYRSSNRKRTQSPKHCYKQSRALRLCKNSLSKTKSFKRLVADCQDSCTGKFGKKIEDAKRQHHYNKIKRLKGQQRACLKRKCNAKSIVNEYNYCSKEASALEQCKAKSKPSNPSKRP